ncbi:hypothetical protein Misp01_44540 [Microtetraspora sp. NBRC 13810]|uniref:ArnT family glycosyltransferase n=1 Tax=Microtetraspora sp. NBRC 13810 TaxID=3030990 RepID=UPI0024A3B0DA|nr:glycosyltransferase family 39 protein [Microtetraspora sp. NBRC 13810]GLW09325.1 hypothetical protein Misp01_44540 [Microtetraspora sp. NBRC 13810]
MPGKDQRPLPRFAGAQVAVVASIVTAGLLVFDVRYGYLRDELYFRMLRDHLDWGYFDQPPLVPFLAWAGTEIFGDNLRALWVWSPIAVGVYIVLAGLVARELGGGRRAQVLAAAAAGTTPWVLGIGHYLITNVFDLPLWTAAILCAVRALRRGDGRWWLAVGAACGLATYNKYLIVLLPLALLAGLLLAGPRRVFLDRWLWLGLLLALVVAAPNLLYQAAHDWPQLTMAGALAEDRGTEFRAIYVRDQFLFFPGPPLAVLWLAGWVRLLRDRTLRAFAVGTLFCSVLVFATGGRPDYVYSLLAFCLVAGCVVIDDWLAAVRWRRLLVGAGVAVNASIAVVAGLSVLPLEVLLRTPLPVNLAVRDSVGWPRLAEQVARVYRGLPPRDRARTILLAGNYGEAGALDLYGPRLGLPAVYSGHNELHRFGPPPEHATTAVVVGTTEALRAEAFTACDRAGRVDNGTGLDNREQGRPILVCRDLRRPWSQLWPKFRHSHHYG